MYFRSNKNRKHRELSIRLISVESKVKKDRIDGNNEIFCANSPKGEPSNISFLLEIDF